MSKKVEVRIIDEIGLIASISHSSNKDKFVIFEKSPQDNYRINWRMTESPVNIKGIVVGSFRAGECKDNYKSVIDKVKEEASSSIATTFMKGMTSTGNF